MSKELTRVWKSGKLNDGLYYIRLEDDKMPIAELETWCRYNIDEHNELTQEFFGYPKNIISEVLAPIPSYDQFVKLTEKVKELKRDVKTLTNNYKLLEDKQASNTIHGQALIDEFGDFEALYEELIRLRKEVTKGEEIIGKLINEGNDAINKTKQLSCLLKECDGCVRSLRARGVSDCNGSNLNDLLTRISAALSESEEK